MKRFFKWMLIGVTALLATIILAAIILPAIYKDKIRVDLEKEIDRQIDADVTFTEVNVRLFSHFPNLTLSLKDLLVMGKDEFKTDTLTSVKEARLELKL